MVCSKRLAKAFDTLSQIGVQPGGGITRLAFTDADWQAREYIIGCMERTGLKVRFDAFGNVIGRREGLNPQAAVVMLGSHIDSVPNGGNFDGAAGVLSAIEIMQCLEDEQFGNYHPIEVVVFMAEESSRFGMATLGSKVFCGKIKFSDLDKFSDQDNISLPAAMRQRGLAVERDIQAQYPGEIKAFLELHIEQGKVLETTNRQIGIVTAIAAPTRLQIIIDGQADHSGATPMHMRYDALTAAAEIILAVEQLAQAAAHQGMVGTTGIVRVHPGVLNVIPGQVELGVDIRGTAKQAKQTVLEQLERVLTAVKQKRQVDIQVKVLTDDQPVGLSEEMVEFLQSLCKCSDTTMLMPSGAGHDAMHLAERTHTGMVFVPCRGGISHNPAEWAEIADIAAGAELLLTAVRTLSGSGHVWKQHVNATEF